MKSALFRKGTLLLKNVDFEEVLSQYEPIIFNQLKKLGIYKNHDNFYQLGLIALWDAHKQFDPAKGKFQTLAISLVRGKMLDELKKERLNEQRYIQYDIQDDADYLPPSSIVVDQVLERETIAAYCIGLSEDQKIWVQMAIVEQKKIGEIAAELNVPVERVKSWRKQAIKKICRNIKEGIMD
jgi:RNA polymerase sigma factor (sigma-70 family)